MIYIPNKINVGFQNRDDTYTGKLAYVIYYDEKGKLRKEKSWNSWRDENIPNIEYENVPLEGFVLNKKVGDYAGYYGEHRKAYTRIYDPRGFEFEITIENLLWILENATSYPGKGLNGLFRYGWLGKDLLLVPCDSPDYKDIIKTSTILNENKTIKVKDLKVGATYLDSNGKRYVYMGKFDRWHYCYVRNGKKFESEYEMKKWCQKMDIKPDSSRKVYWGGTEYIWNPDSEGHMTIKKEHVFQYEFEDFNWLDDNKKEYFTKNKFLWLSSLGKKFISCENEECVENYAELFEELEGTTPYSYIDDSKDEVFPLSYKEFVEELNDYTFQYPWKDFYINRKWDSGDYMNFHICRTGVYGEYYINNSEIIKLFNLPKITEYKSINYSAKDLYDILKPIKIKKYLANGRFYKWIK